MAQSSERFEKVRKPFEGYTSDSSLSDDDREQIEHVLEHGAPEVAMTPEREQMVVLDTDVVGSAPTGVIPTAGSSWINRIKSAGASVMGSIRPTSSGQEGGGQSEERQPKKKWKAKLWSTWNNIKYSSTWMSDRSEEYGGNNEVVFLGRRYSTKRDGTGTSVGFEDFCSDYYSRIWITYRTEFSPLLDSETTSDCGWGCMIRTTQMMTAQAIMLNRFGRDWRFARRKRSQLGTSQGEETVFDREKQQELLILKLFEDKPSAPLGIHRMVEIAAADKGKKAVGSWYSPSEAVFIMKKALVESISPFTGDTAMFLSIDGRVHIRDVEIETKNWMKTLVLVIVVRLGAAQLNPIYVPHLMRLFSMESFLGVTGGRPDHSSWFVGYYGDQVIYLDPHVAHEYIPINVNFSEIALPGSKKAKKCPERSYHCRLLSKMHFLDMDPSCALCFRFESREHFDRDMRQLNLSQFIDIDQGEEHGMKRVQDPMFSVVYGERRRETAYEDTTTDAERAHADSQGFEML